MATNPSASSSQAPSWAAEANSPVAYHSRKALPIKRNDAEPLSREDVQFDLLDYIFSDTRAVFTDPNSGSDSKVTFGNLYVSALYTSSKCSKVLKEKMVETPAFSIEFAKIALLTNVGRINTTMAFFPEMKTALRTYHPVPSLQKTDGNAQDAPRIKNCLKAALLPTETRVPPPSTPEEVLTKLRAGIHPPTSVVNLIFVLANHAAPLASIHFDGSLNFLDLFLPRTWLSSTDRGRAFLWLVYHYLEKENPPNPFDDTHSTRYPGKVPSLRRLTPQQYQSENVDTPEEIQWGNMMSAHRNRFLQRLVTTIEVDRKARASTAPHFVTETGNNLPRSQRQEAPLTQDSPGFLFYVPSTQPDPALPQSKRPYNRHRTSVSEGQERTMFEQAWHMASIDPLVDSDEETQDENTRLDYTRRLGVISRILRRPPTPT
ncbi:hypothetical protein BDN70DRAFT_833438 [Pholiota conissans]|uniref:Ino eighty subunit 1 n=1 Tax=Pholiota conissans TaxID=109636 RepID=A0A9P5Z608_9AGAR|nr:hypothetical protein BDN70DRAFT_833438 [Pholiota conissans]